MEEKIYTIPITDAFRQECECAMCLLEKDLEERYLDDILDNSTMDVHTRLETNKQGFCKMHLEKMYSVRFKRLQIGLLLDSYLHDHNSTLENRCKALVNAAGEEPETIFDRLRPSGRKCESNKKEALQRLIETLREMECECSICGRVEQGMYRYCDIIILLWMKEEEFRELFSKTKGFCRKHFRQLLEMVGKQGHIRGMNELLTQLVQMEVRNFNRIGEEVHSFTQLFAYHNKDVPAGSSRDALIRGIQKIVGFCDLNYR